jgi:hypothetical protein
MRGLCAKKSCFVHFWQASNRWPRAWCQVWLSHFRFTQHLAASAAHGAKLVALIWHFHRNMPADCFHLVFLNLSRFSSSRSSAWAAAQKVCESLAGEGRSVSVMSGNNPNNPGTPQDPSDILVNWSSDPSGEREERSSMEAGPPSASAQVEGLWTSVFFVGFRRQVADFLHYSGLIHTGGSLLYRNLLKGHISHIRHIRWS